jgi:hypothetical protein
MRIPGSIPLRRSTLRFTVSIMIIWYALRLLHHIWCFNESSYQARFDVPFNVAMEELDACCRC